MAGGKLSPRQKMINMMYLVLTALLAMNVSAEILDAFNSLRESLHESAESFEEKNLDTKKAIKAKVEEELEQGNKKNEHLIAVVDEIEEETGKVITEINGILEKLSEIAGYEAETKEFKNMKETEMNFQMWMGPGGDAANGGRGQGKALELKNMFNTYLDDLEAIIKKNESDSTASAAIESMGLEKLRLEDHEGEGKLGLWEYHTFHGKPVIADMAMMEKLKLDIQEAHSEALNWAKTKLGQVTFKIDSLIAVDAPLSRVVAAGMKFETKLFVAMSSSEIKPEFIGATADPGGNSGTLTAMAQGGFPQGKNSKMQSYSAKILVPKTDGTKEELVIQGEFEVRKPEVVITSASVQNLYYKCGNKLNVDVPALGEFYSPVFSASNAETIKGNEKKVVTVVPSGKVCVLSVSSITNGQTIKIDDIKYNVIKPPKPDLRLYANNKEYNPNSSLPKNSNCLVKVDPDNDFKNALPADARYAINSVNLLSKRSLGAPTKVTTFSGNGKDATKGIPCPLGNYLKSDPPGTKIYFQIDNVYRINFKNQKVKEEFTDVDLYIDAVIK